MKIKLRLMSDLCVGSGEGLAGVVDMDVPFDQYGIPYIPSKRMKGCLREAARELADADPDFDFAAFDRLFGKPGGEAGILKLGNGRIAHYPAVVRELETLFRHKDYKNYLRPWAIQNYYTTMRTQTSIDPAMQTAQKHTLRTVRLIKAGLEFYFDVTLEEYNEQCVQLLEKCCKVLRHIGLNRTRGWGEVQCGLICEPSQVVEDSDSPSGEKKIPVPDGETLCQVPYTLVLKSPLFVSNRVGYASASDDYISGGQMLGVLAAAYSIRYGREACGQDKPLFRQLFLSNEVKYLNAYPVHSETGERCLPMPLSIVRKKDGDDLFDLAFDGDEENVRNNDLQTVGLNGFLSPSNLPDVVEIQSESEIAYHHQRPRDRTIGHAQEGNGQFFQMEVLCGGQVFKGMILGKAEPLLRLKELVNDAGIVRIGRSKTAQYAEAELHWGDIVPFTGETGDAEHVSLSIEPEEQVVVTLTSPMILFDEETCDVRPNPRRFAELLNKKFPGFEYVRSYGRTVRVSGFHGKWGMPRPQVDALDAGSVIVLRYVGEENIPVMELERESYGLRQNEGFGRIVVNMHGFGNVTPGKAKPSELSVPFTPSLTKDLLTYTQKEEVRSIVRDLAMNALNSKRDGQNEPGILTKINSAALFKMMAKLKSVNDREEFEKWVEEKKDGKYKEAYKAFAEFMEPFSSLEKKITEQKRWRALSTTTTEECRSFVKDSNFELYRLFVETLFQQLKWFIREKKGAGETNVPSRAGSRR